MQMIATSKLKKAQDTAVSSRPYVEKLTILSQTLANKLEEQDLSDYMKEIKDVGSTLLLVFSPDKGLCGGLVTNLVREYLTIQKNENALFVSVGKKIEGTIASTNKQLLASFPFGSILPSFDMVYPLLDIINEKFLSGEVGEVKIVTTQFASVFSQKVHVSHLLPVMLPENEEKEQPHERLFEPSAEILLPAILKRYIEIELYQHLLESFASECAARMIAMQNATNNAKDIVNQFRLLYNKARQERITNEILDISSAAVTMEQDRI